MMMIVEMVMMIIEMVMMIIEMVMIMGDDDDDNDDGCYVIIIIRMINMMYTHVCIHIIQNNMQKYIHYTVHES